MTTDGTRIRRALEFLHQAASDNGGLSLTVVETAALSTFVTELTTDRDQALAAIARRRGDGVIPDDRGDLRDALSDLTEVNRVLTSERDLARANRHMAVTALGEVGRILRSAAGDDEMHPMNDASSYAEAVQWLVDDWRVERASNEVDHDRNRTTAAADTTDDGPLDTWAIVEMLGHRRLAGRVREVQLAGAGMLRLDIPAAGTDPARTQYISPASLYALHPCGEPTARAAAAQWRPDPVQRWELPGLAKPVDAELVDGGRPNLDDGSDPWDVGDQPEAGR